MPRKGPHRPVEYVPSAPRVAAALKALILPTLLFVSFSSPVSAQKRDMVVAAVNSNNRAALQGHHPAWAITQNDLGVVPADLAIAHVEIVLSRSPEMQQAFEQFLAAQQDPTSPEFHHWLTAAEIGDRFGASDHDIAAVTDWLQSQNLHPDAVANSRIRIIFSGSAQAIGNAFSSDLHYFSVGGEQRISVGGDPQVPVALLGIVQSISGLYEMKTTPSYGSGTVHVSADSSGTGAQEYSESGPNQSLVPAFNASASTHFIAPADFAKIYDLPGGTITGSGQTIAIIGRARVYNQDITNFQSISGLAQQAPTVIIPPLGTDPGPAQTAPPANNGTPSGDQGEATLDVTRTTSVAPGAIIDLVISANTMTTSGVQIATEYVVDANPVFAHVMSISFGSCEANAGQAGANFWNSLFSQAAAEGISVFVSSGDAGAAGCDTFFTAPPASQGLSTNVICSSSAATCVGGTEFNDSPASTYWATSEGANRESALSYIPEGGWNEPTVSGGGTQAASSGGGFSLYIATPSWQTGTTGIPSNQGRYTPDVSFSASGHDGYFACFAAATASCATGGSFTFEYFFGTSAAAPDMAGIAALLDQKFGAPQGNLNPNLYKLAATPSNGVFHDVTATTSGIGAGCSVSLPSMCNNSTPGPSTLTGGLAGYLVTTGYDEVTGLGSIDVAKLLVSWNGASTALTSSLNPSTIGAAVTFTATVTSPVSPAPTGTVTFLDNGSSIGNGTVGSGGVVTLILSNLTVGSHPITAQYGGDGNYVSGVSNVLSQVVTLFPSTTTLASSLNPSVGGQSVTFTATVAGSGGTPTGTITFLDGATSLGTVTLSGGVATLATTQLTVAAHSISASYAGDTKFSPSTSAPFSQAVNVAGFAAAPGGLTVATGQSATIPLTLFQATGSTLNFQLSCTGLPSKSTCAFSPATIVAAQAPTGSAITLTFGTASSGVPGSPANHETHPGQWLGISAMLAAIMAACSMLWSRAPRRRLAYGFGFALLLLSLGAMGCGNTTPPYTGTPKGAANFTVTATSGGNTTSVNVTVTVQ